MSAAASSTVTHAAEAAKESLISAASHVMEVPDLWATRLRSAFRDKAPRHPERRVGEGATFFFDSFGARPCCCGERMHVV